MQYAACKVPAAPVRRKAAHQSEIVNTVLFGETVMILKEKKKWARVRVIKDNYEGWMTFNQLEEVSEEMAVAFNPWITGDLLNKLEFANNSMNVPIASSLPGFDGLQGKFGNIEYHFSGNKIKRNEVIPGADAVKSLSMQWINAPYLWGGRTPLGVDCSGFVQTIFKMMGIDLPRDAWQQAQVGERIKKLRDALTGDLAFFDDKEEIVHVGILLNSEQIIHASGKVRIDAITKKGIINSDTGKRTHRLRAIRRHW
ncbi:MAG TPA: C40 family peptidase [Chitinophagaceae bacterium]|nr:C40 family peptidase [Chitinophagaceae bacterium]